MLATIEVKTYTYDYKSLQSRYYFPNPIKLSIQKISIESKFMIYTQKSVLVRLRPIYLNIIGVIVPLSPQRPPTQIC